ncbi:MAG: bifunctional pyr operon transcriptional regulator/uracil phosphoribosyltransferase PyrR [Candidatus Margulisiibacteriota bacterium]
MAKLQGKILMSAADIARSLKRMAQEIIEKDKGAGQLVLVGIMDGGLPIAKRLSALIEESEKKKVPVGGLDVSLYRDDLSIRGKNIEPKKSDISFSIDKKIVILVDDVLFHGRTVRAALDSLNDYGRPAKVQLAVLVDRGNRELPIQPDFCGKKITSSMDDQVVASLTENGGEDQVVIR